MESSIGPRSDATGLKMKKLNLSIQMWAVVDHMRATGQPLRRWTGGWWGTVGSPLRQFNGLDVPIPDFPTITVKALEMRGVIQRARVHDKWWDDDFVLVEAIKK